MDWKTHYGEIRGVFFTLYVFENRNYFWLHFLTRCSIITSLQERQMSMAHGHTGEENTDGCRTYECGFVWIEEIQIMGERNVIKAALLGAGTVGSGVYALSEM